MVYTLGMYIRAVKTRIKDKTYIAHRLVESYKNAEGKPRQRTIMNLGILDIPKNRWTELAFLLEQRINGQRVFLSGTPELEKTADDLYARGDFSKSEPKAREEAEQKREIVKVDLNSVSVSESRSLGPELVAANQWQLLELEETLEDCRFNERQRSVAKALILGKLIAPSSELETWRWLNNRTALSEMTSEDVTGLGKDSYYETADLLYKNKDKIELALYNRETTLFSLERRLFLFDLTNTYMEGECKCNGLAQYGKSKEKRKDCPLVSLALMVDEKGFPVYSRICKGNQSEPETLIEVLEELKCAGRLQTGSKQPMLVMDRGIATHKNIETLNERGYSYIVIERRPAENEYEADYRELKGIISGKEPEGLLSALGWQQGWSQTVSAARASGRANEVYIKRKEYDGRTSVLCFSVNKEAKELSMSKLKETRFLEDISRLKASVEAGNIILAHKVGERIGRIKQKYPGIGNCYEIELVCGEREGHSKSVRWTKKAIGERLPILAGCYVIETNRAGIPAAEIWRDYMTLTRVESAFRDLKSELGIRPIYHQLEERTKSHLFIGVLAYHLLTGIENRLLEKGDHREWKTIKAILSTHQRSTVTMTGENRNLYHIRVSGKPEVEHLNIYRCLGVKDHLKTKKTVVYKESSDKVLKPLSG